MRWRNFITLVGGGAMWILNLAVTASLAITTSSGEARAWSNGKDVPRLAFLGFELINTSLEPTAQAEVERIHLLDDIAR